MVLLGQILLASGLITEDDLKAALEEQKRNGRLIGEILRERGLVTGRQVWQAWMTQLACRYSRLAEIDAPLEVRRLAFGDLAEHYLAVPISLNDKTGVLIRGFSDMPLIDDLRVLYGLDRIVVATLTPRVARAIRRNYPEVEIACCTRCGESIASPEARLSIDENGEAVFLCPHCWKKVSFISGFFEAEEGKTGSS